MEISDSKWAEVERRMMALEERTSDMLMRLNTHEAVCLERQRTMLNTMAAIQNDIAVLETNVLQMSVRTDIKMDGFSTRLNTWMTAVAGGAILATGSLAALIMTHGLK